MSETPIPLGAALALVVMGMLIGGGIVAALLNSARRTERAPWRPGLAIVVVVGLAAAAFVAR